MTVLQTKKYISTLCILIIFGYCLCETTQQLRITNIDHRRSEGAESKDHGNDQDFLVLAKGQEIQMMCVQYAANIL